MIQIFQEFIEEVEGYSLVGYVPEDDGGAYLSGVTIGMGYDLGQQTWVGLKALCLPRDTEKALEPYLGLTGETAKQALKEKPLTLSRGAVDILNKKVIDSYAVRLSLAYNQDSKGVLFDSLPPQIQTAIFSVNLQYGNAKKRCPRFWDLVTSQRWAAAVKELENFGDKFPKRRLKEASLIKTVLWRN